MKALLELTESSPDDFQKLAESAMGTGVEKTTEAMATEAASVSSAETSTTSDGSVDTSSDGGSTVRELNKQLEEDSGTPGIASATTGMAEGEVSVSEWQTCKRSRGGSNKSSSPLGNSAASKKGRINADLIMFVKGVNFDIARRPIEFSCKLSSVAGQVSEVKLVKDCTILGPSQGRLRPLRITFKAYNLSGGGNS